MTLSEIKQSDKVMLLPKDIAPVLGCHEHAIRLAAKENDLPFPFFRSGNRIKRTDRVKAAQTVQCAARDSERSDQ